MSGSPALNFHDPDELIRLAAAMQAPQERYLKWRQIAERWERGRHSALAKIIQKIRGETEKASQAQLESMAYASEEWAEYERNWDAAEKKKIVYQVKYENLRCQWESLRTVITYERDGMKHGILA